MSVKICPICEKITYGKRNRKYCSDACKMKAYRRRLEPETGSWSRRRAGAQKGVQTRQRTHRRVTCVWCGESRNFDLQTTINRRYCSDACKAKAHRARVKFRDTGHADVTTLESLNFWLPLILNAARRKHQYVHMWQREPVTVEIADGVALVVNEHGETLWTFDTPETAADQLNRFLSVGLLRA